MMCVFNHSIRSNTSTFQHDYEKKTKQNEYITDIYILEAIWQILLAVNLLLPEISTISREIEGERKRDSAKTHSFAHL